MIVTLDFEGYYSQEYTLKKLSTSEYIRDPRFEALSVAIKAGDEPTHFFKGADIAGALAMVDWKDAELLAHHAQFDGLILSHHYGHVPRRYLCTLSMARGLFPKSTRNDLGSLAERLGLLTQKLDMPDFKGRHLADITPDEWALIELYNKADVDSCAQAYAAMASRLPATELDLIDITVRMFADPVLRLDTKRAKDELAREKKAKRDAIEESGALEKELASTAKSAKLLEALGVPVPQKLSPRTHKLIPALAQTDVEFTSLANHPDDRVKKLVAGRLAVKSTLGETRVKRLIYSGSKRRRIPVYVNFCGAHTTRWTGGDKLNFQNLPRDGVLKGCLLAPPGCVLVGIDSRQIEPRVLAWLAGERWLLEEFRKGSDADPYSVFASMVYGRHIDRDVDKDERFIGKVCVLALGYSMGAARLQAYLAQGVSGPPLALPLEVCQGYVNMYRQKSSNIRSLWDVMNDAIGDVAKGREGGLKCLTWRKDEITLPNGMVLHYPDTDAVVETRRPSGMFRGEESREIVLDGSYLTFKGRSKLYGGLLTENVVQALSRVIVAEQMRQIAKRYRVVLMTHDEVVYVAPKRAAQSALDFGTAVMRTPPPWGMDIPLDVEGGFADRYE